MMKQQPLHQRRVALGRLRVQLSEREQRYYDSQLDTLETLLRRTFPHAAIQCGPSAYNGESFLVECGASGGGAAGASGGSTLPISAEQQRAI